MGEAFADRLAVIEQYRHDLELLGYDKSAGAVREIIVALSDLDDRVSKLALDALERQGKPLEGRETSNVTGPPASPAPATRMDLAFAFAETGTFTDSVGVAVRVLLADPTNAELKAGADYFSELGVEENVAGAFSLISTFLASRRARFAK